MERMKTLWIALAAAVSAPWLHGEDKAAGLTSIPAVRLFETVDGGSHIVIDQGAPGTEGIKYGFEGGRVVKLDGFYHLITAEQYGDPELVKMRLAHWRSADGEKWQRISTLYESSGEFEGKDPRAALWGPMPIFDETADCWYLVYVAYRSKPNDDTGWYLNYEGRIWLAKSTVPGRNGIGGPYENVGIILQPDQDSDPWEGLQGTDSFFPYRVGDSWYAFYGSAQTQKNRNPAYPKWAVGLARADRLEGPWERLSSLNPVILDPQFAENPVVSRLEDGRYIAMLDGGWGAPGCGYSVSDDGIHWSRAVFADLASHGKWWKAMRTPLGLIPEDDGTYTVFHTALTESGFAKLGRVRLKKKIIQTSVTGNR